MSSTAGIATRVNEALVAEALSSFYSEEDAAKCVVTPTQGGVNNMVQYVDTPSGARVVLRIYNNGCNTPRVAYEHAILKALGVVGPFSFGLPSYVAAKSGVTFVPLKNGAMACVSQLIPGGLPKTTDPEPIGRATGELLTALGKIDPSQLPPCPTPPYFKLYDVHHAVGGDRAKYIAYVTGPALDVCRPAMDRLLAQGDMLDAALVTMRADGALPMGLIHGDLHYDNVLQDLATGEVSGLLDFEFSAYDWRAMELAVCLSKYVGEADPLPLVQRFVAGFARYGRLSRAECEALPEMINLRVYSNVVYFVGRALAGEDTIDSLTTRAATYATRMEWVRANRRAITDCLVELMRTHDPDFK
jgi:Ser/Thr protein kinase RdoA (MazF antagonist)